MNRGLSSPTYEFIHTEKHTVSMELFNTKKFLRNINWCDLTKVKWEV